MTECSPFGIVDRRTVPRAQAMIEDEWKLMPKRAKEFLLGMPLESLTLERFASFWSSPLMYDHLKNFCDGRANDKSITLALNYLFLGKVNEARAVMLNGSFIMDCMHLDNIANVFKLKYVNEPCVPELPCFAHAYYSAKTPKAMENFLQRMLESHQFKNVAKAATSWSKSGDGAYSDGSHHKPSSNASTETQIQVILEEGVNAEEWTILTIGSSTKLKTLFNDYAEKRGVSLRSLRFSYNDKTLFLSSVGNRTPDDLNMKDRDAITVHNVNSISSEASDASTTTKKKVTPKSNAKRHKNSRKKTKGKGKKEDKRKEETKTLEEYRADHSKLLTKIHDEVQSRLKEIRIRLHALDIERQPKKQKRVKRGRNKAKGHVNDISILPKSGVGGKAGRPYFLVNVGEVQNLYKRAKSPQDISCNTPTLDLHGCTRFEALQKLDESLQTWFNAAMQGSYPFVISAKIVCGCGNQVLAETIENWIRQNAQVANSPKR